MAAGSKVATVAVFAKRGYIVIGHKVHVIEGSGIEVEKRGQLRGGELADVGPNSQAVPHGGAQDALRLFHAEGTALAEDVDIGRELALRSGGYHVVADDADVFFGIVAELRRDDVRAKQCGDDRSSPLLRGAGDGFQRFDLGFEA